SRFFSNLYGLWLNWLSSKSLPCLRRLYQILYMFRADCKEQGAVLWCSLQGNVIDRSGQSDNENEYESFPKPFPYQTYHALTPSCIRLPSSLICPHLLV